MSRISKLQIRFGKLEGALLIAIAALVFQLFPWLRFGLWEFVLNLGSLLDFRTWPRVVWFAINLLVLIGLFVVRFGPSVYTDWQVRHKRAHKGQRQQAAVGSDESNSDPDYEARVRRDAEWRERAKKRLPWHT